MRVVLDSNVISAAFSAQGLCHLLFEVILQTHEFVLSPELLKEIEKCFIQKIKLPEKRTKEIINLIKFNSIFLNDEPSLGLICRDPEDIKVLSLAIQSQAECLITGDKDLLVLKKINHTTILTPRDFWEKLKKSDETR